MAVRTDKLSLSHAAVRSNDILFGGCCLEVISKFCRYDLCLAARHCNSSTLSSEKDDDVEDTRMGSRTNVDDEAADSSFFDIQI